MAKRGRKPNVPYVQKYEYYLYKKHPSGIGSTYIKTMETTVKPSFDNGCFRDVTNDVWARWDTDPRL